MRDTVIVAMSGGVDSSVAALILKESKYNVIGVTFDINGKDGENLSIKAAKQVADKLDIPHRTISLKETFEQKVVDYFTDEYQKGRTPNPCIVCNRTVKFRYLLEMADEEGAGYIATGHYARVISTSRQGYLLSKGIDTGKDQSYFLILLGQKELERTIFPVGDFTKKNVVEIAKKMGLPSLQGESKDVCFLSGGDYRAFIKERLPDGAGCGDIVDTSGKVIGEHEGYFNYTIGQRRKIGLPSSEPYYVVSIIPDKNRVVVGRKKHLYKREVKTPAFNWISERPEYIIEEPISLLGKIRYNQPLAMGNATFFRDNSAIMEFDEPQSSPASGQGLAIYDGDILLGGGFIT